MHNDESALYLQLARLRKTIESPHHSRHHCIQTILKPAAFPSVSRIHGEKSILFGKSGLQVAEASCFRPASTLRFQAHSIVLFILCFLCKASATLAIADEAQKQTIQICYFSNSIQAMTKVLSFLIALSWAWLAQANEYVSDPNAPIGGNGSKENPWPSLEQSIASGYLKTLKPGDSLILLEGYHGEARFSGINDDFITIAAAPGHDARLAKLHMSAAAKWHIKNLRISPTFAPKSNIRNIVYFGERAPESGQVIIEGCEIFGVDDHTKLTAKTWLALPNGILVGRHAKGSIVKNCYIRNTRFALQLSAYDNVAEGNVIENFSGDGLRMNRDGQKAIYNVIKKSFVTDGNGDKNHDDAIQCFLHSKGTGLMRNLTLSHNIIIGHEPGVEPNAANNHGIGLFDGPLENFRIENNVIMVSHWHGISVFDGQGCTIVDNIVWSQFNGKLKPWIMLGEKQGKAIGNTVKNNYAMSFNLNQPETTKSNNQIVTKAIYEQGLETLSKEHIERYGKIHPVAKRNRITGEPVGSEFKGY